MKAISSTVILLAWSSVSDGEVPHQLSNQGRISQNGVNLDGIGHFKFTILDDGSDLNVQATATATVNNGFLTSIAIDNSGLGYLLPPSVTISDPTGSGSTAEAEVSGGTLTTIKVLTPGSGYSLTPTVTISPPDAPLAVSLWSNDGTSVSGSEPSTAVQSPLAQGHYAVRLGGIGVPGMTVEIPLSLFRDNESVRLRTWFSATGEVGSFEQLSPDHHLLPTPFAFHAATADDITPGTSLSLSELHVGSDLAGVDDVLHFRSDSGDEFFKWVESRSRLEFSDDLALSGILQAGGLNVNNPVSYNRIGTGGASHGLSGGQDLLVSGSVEVNQALYVDQSISVGTENSTNDDRIRFDGEGPESEFLQWTEAKDRFDLSNDLAINGNLQVGAHVDPPVGYSRIGSNIGDHITGTGGGDLLVSKALEVDGVIYADGDLHVGRSSPDSFHTIFFDATPFQYLRWYQAGQEFELSSALAIRRNLQTGSESTTVNYNRMGTATTNHSLTGDSDLLVSSRLEVNGACYLDNALYIGTDSGNDDDFIYFDGGGTAAPESFGWAESESRFELSDELAISGPVRAGSSAQTPVLYSYFGNGSVVPNSSLISSIDDVFIEDDLEVHSDLVVAGSITASVKNFRIDHPLDPDHQYLQHAAIESDQYRNLYDGTLTLDQTGKAVVELPSWFESLNREFRYQLTPIGGPGPDLYIAEEIADDRFTIAGGSPGLKVSWQVTGIRHDRWAEKNPLDVELPKDGVEEVAMQRHRDYSGMGR